MSPKSYERLTGHIRDRYGTIDKHYYKKNQHSGIGDWFYLCSQIINLK